MQTKGLERATLESIARKPKRTRKKRERVNNLLMKGRIRKTFNEKGMINGIILYLVKNVLKGNILSAKIYMRYLKQTSYGALGTETHTIRNEEQMLKVLKELFYKYYPTDFDNEQLSFLCTFEHYRSRYQHLLRKAQECKGERDKAKK